MNKKGQVIEGVLIIAAVMVMIATIVAVITYEKAVSDSIGPPKEVLDFYFKLDGFNIYHQEAGKIAIIESYGDVASKLQLNSENCKTVGNVVIWDENCGPDNSRISEKFISGVSEKFREITGKKEFKIELERDKVVFTPGDFDSSVFVIKEYIKYNLSKSFYSSFSLEAPSLDFEEAYSQAILLSKFCENKTDFTGCMKDFNFKGWNSGIGVKGDYLLFTLSTEKSHLYGGDFKPIKTRFAIQKLS